MSYITIPAAYLDWKIVPTEKITKEPYRVLLTLEYLEEDKSEEDSLKTAMDDYKNWKNIYEMEDLSNLMKKRWIID